MTQQDFIFTSGIWLGEGKITFSSASDSIKFFTKWNVFEQELGVIKAVQIVEMEGIEDQTINTYSFYDFQEVGFSAILENALVGKVVGKGIRGNNIISWYFSNTATFEGLETYERQANGDYIFHAEYGPEALFKTLIDGVIWRKLDI